MLKYNRAWYYSHMSIAFYLPGSIAIYSFSLLLGIGSSVGLWGITKQSEEQNRSLSLDAGLWAMFAALFGARLAYVVGHWPYFRHNVIEIFEIYKGGLSWPGALLGGVLSIIIFARIRKISAGKLGDALLPLGASLMLSAWLGCWLNGCAYGSASNAWWGLKAVDEWGVVSDRWPVQLVGALLIAVIFWLVEKKRASFHAPGQAASVFLSSGALLMFALTYLRGDSMPVWNGLRWDAWAAVIFAAFGLLSFIIINKSKLVESFDSI